MVLEKNGYCRLISFRFQSLDSKNLEQSSLSDDSFVPKLGSIPRLTSYLVSHLVCYLVCYLVSFYEWVQFDGQVGEPDNRQIVALDSEAWKFQNPCVIARKNADQTFKPLQNTARLNESFSSDKKLSLSLGQTISVKHFWTLRNTLKHYWTSLIKILYDLFVCLKKRHTRNSAGLQHPLRSCANCSNARCSTCEVDARLC